MLNNKLVSFVLICILFATSCTKENTNAALINQTNKGGSLARFTVVGNYLYAINNSELKVFDVTNANNPILENTILVDNNIETIYPFKDKLFIAGNLGMFMYNISDPVNPIKEGSVQHITGCDPVVVNGKYAYLTIHSGTTCHGNINELQIYDLTNGVNSASFVKSITLTSPIGLGLHNNYLFVCDKGNGLIVYDITNGNNPVEFTKITDENYIDVIPYNNTLICMLEDGIAYYDISNMNAISKLSVIK